MTLSHLITILFFQIKALSDQFSFVYLSSIIKQIITVFKKYYIKKIFIASNKYHNTMSQHPQIISLIPFKPIFNNEIDTTKHWDYIYEPNPKHLLDILINRYLYSQIYLNILENLVCEQAARMIAMRTATDNSDNLIKELQLVYNKIRQSNITKELTEIISGASAIALN
ncbi:hypothetical protein HIC20_00555 [Buchnera aphidicola (Hormaphis cornu)]|nr:hypothetical protein HIC20_00555 [Buchnera aphidicola (Hormaphis cornu)]